MDNFDDMRRIIATYIEGIGAGQYRVQPGPAGVQHIYLGLELLARLSYGADGYLTIEVVDDMLQAVNAAILVDRRHRLPLVHPNLFELLLAFLSP